MIFTLLLKMYLNLSEDGTRIGILVIHGGEVSIQASNCDDLD